MFGCGNAMTFTSKTFLSVRKMRTNTTYYQTIYQFILLDLSFVTNSFVFVTEPILGG